MKQKIGLTFDEDGEFWMTFKDWMKHFDCVEMCNLCPDLLSEDQVSSERRGWIERMFEGKFQGATADGRGNFLDTFWRNPRYVFSLKDPDENDGDGNCTVIVALMQKNRRSRQGQKSLTIGFKIYHVTENELMNGTLKTNFFENRASVARSSKFTHSREVSFFIKDVK